MKNKLDKIERQFFYNSYESGGLNKKKNNNVMDISL